MNKAIKIFIIINLFFLNCNYSLAGCFQETGQTVSDCGSRNVDNCEVDTNADTILDCYWSDGSGNSGGSDGSGNSPTRKAGINNPVGSNDNININEYIGKFINGVLGIVGSLALLFFVYGGFMWMTATGNAERVEKAKSILIWNTFGIIVIFTAYAIIKFVLESLGAS